MRFRDIRASKLLDDDPGADGLLALLLHSLALAGGVEGEICRSPVGAGAGEGAAGLAGGGETGRCAKAIAEAAAQARISRPRVLVQSMGVGQRTL